MNLIIRVFSFIAVCNFSITVNADLVPQKRFEFDLKKLTGRDVKDLSPNGDVSYQVRPVYGPFGSSNLHIITVTYRDEERLGPIRDIEKDHYIILANSNGDFKVIENLNYKSTYQKFNLYYYTSRWEQQGGGSYHLLVNYCKVSNKNYNTLEVDQGEDKTEVYRVRVSIDEELSIIGKDKYIFSDYDQGGADRFRKGNIIQEYDLSSWVETEGENSEPQIRFSKITPNEVTIEGETTKGGTIERSTDLKNWKKLVKVNKGGFEVFVDPTEKNKEFFRVKSE